MTVREIALFIALTATCALLVIAQVERAFLRSALDAMASPGPLRPGDRAGPGDTP